jgi:hypothetical protein
MKIAYEKTTDDKNIRLRQISGTSTQNFKKSVVSSLLLEERKMGYPKDDFTFAKKSWHRFLGYPLFSFRKKGNLFFHNKLT